MNTLRTEEEFDVVVVGAGLAGTMAAVTAADRGARVAIVHEGPLFSGSSFFPGTWGLGLIGPENAEDAADLSRTIQEVGCRVALDPLVDSFVAGIDGAIERIEAKGVVLKQAERAGEVEFIPCFDYKHRHWRGIVRENYTGAIGGEIARSGIVSIGRATLMSVVKDGERACGVVVFSAGEGSFVKIPAKAVVLATGGIGGLFSRRLVAADVDGSACSVALEAGCSLINIEFLQMMPGIIHPCTGAVFNEKMFRHMALSCADGSSPFAGRDDAWVADVLECRSGHGPFTSRLISREVDLAIDASGAEGIVARYKGGSDMPEFARTYYDWLEKEKGVRADDELRLSLFAHASNGGIAISEDTATGVPGLFACGEATGGMHGADRIGGLSSANALVFGIRAGEASASWAAQSAASTADAEAVSTGDAASPRAHQIASSMRRIMTQHCMVRRSGEGLAEADRALASLERELAASSEPCADEGAVALTSKVRHQLLTARAFVAAAAARNESRGSHYRIDAPTEDPAQAHARVLSFDAEGGFSLRPAVRAAGN